MSEFSSAPLVTTSFEKIICPMRPSSISPWSGAEWSMTKSRCVESMTILKDSSPAMPSRLGRGY